MTGAYGVYVNHTAYERMISMLEKETFIADVGYMNIGLNIYRTLENLVLHRPGYSYIRKKDVNYKRLNQ